MSGTEMTLMQPAAISARMEYARALAASGMIPRHYQAQPANVLVAIETGMALGIPPIQALSGIAVINGRASMSSDLMAAVVRRAGHTLRVREHDGAVTATVIRSDDPGYEFEVTWDEAKARQAGLWGGRGPWSQYPTQMLRARAITEVCRQAASDALMGVIYTPEELGASEDEDGTPVIVGEASAQPVESGRHRLVRTHLERAGVDADPDAVLAEAAAAGVEMTPASLAGWLHATYPASAPATHTAEVVEAVVEDA